MKFIARSLVILLVSAAVAGGTYLAVTRGPWDARDMHAESRSRHQRHASEAEAGRPLEDYPAGGFSSRNHRSREGVSFGRGLAGIIRSLSLIAFTTFVITRMSCLRRSSNARSWYRGKSASQADASSAQKPPGNTQAP